MRIVTLDENNKVVGVKNVRDDYSVGENELISDVGECGQILQPDGTFIDDPTPPPEAKPSLEEQVAQLKEDNLILMDALATVFEELLITQTMIGGTP